MKRLALIVGCLSLGVALGVYLGGTGLQGQGPRAPAVPKEMTSYRDIVKRVLPAVISIEAQATGGGGGPVRVGYGSGFILDPKGVLVTNHHVVAGADQVLVLLADGRKFTSRDIKSDAKTDLAVVRFTPTGALPHLEFSDSDEMEIGDRVLAIGAPFGLAGSVTHGIISGKGRSLGVNIYEDFLQTDAAINPGNSGGPLISLEGKVVGINSAIKSRTGGFQGIGLAISANLAQVILRQLVREGVVRRGYLGVQTADVADEAASRKLGLPDLRGVRITEVVTDGPGEKAGLRENDVIVALDGRPIRDGRTLQLAVAGLALGKAVDLRVVRAGKVVPLKVTVQEQPKEFGSARPGLGGIRLESIGVTVGDLTRELAGALGYREGTRGALITRIDTDGLAAAARLRPGLLITAVDGRTVATARECSDRLREANVARGVRLRVASWAGGSVDVLLRSRE